MLRWPHGASGIKASSASRDRRKGLASPPASRARTGAGGEGQGVLAVAPSAPCAQRGRGRERRSPPAHLPVPAGIRKPPTSPESCNLTTRQGRGPSRRLPRATPSGTSRGARRRLPSWVFSRKLGVVLTVEAIVCAPGARLDPRPGTTSGDALGSPKLDYGGVGAGAWEQGAQAH